VAAADRLAAWPARFSCDAVAQYLVQRCCLAR
jgi:hypothetical protein